MKGRAGSIKVLCLLASLGFTRGAAAAAVATTSHANGTEPLGGIVVILNGMILRKMRLALPAVLAGLALSCSDSTEPSQPRADFVVAVGQEMFVLRSSDPETIRLATENLEGRNSRFPLGPLRSGNGGFNAPWSWHLDPAETRMVEAAIEVCDGTPSYVEAHQQDFPTYCPWGARVVGRR